MPPEPGRPPPPRTIWINFRGDLATCLMFDHMSVNFGRTLSATMRRALGMSKTSPTTRATPTTTASRIQTVLAFPPDSGVTSKLMELQAKGSEMRKSAPLTAQLAVLTTALELRATEAS